MNIFLKFLINKHSVISFDIFDTLIERKVSDPTDIFFLAGESVLHDSEKALEFKKQRVIAEQEARRKAENGEVNLDDIYACLKNTFAEMRAALKNAEIEQELKNCYRKSCMTEVFEYSLRQGKTVILTSDMYLSETVIADMLTQCDIHGYKQCYVSNEYKKNKISGELFRYILKERGLKNSQVLHIGDSLKADSIGPLKCGICPFLIGRRNRWERLLHRLKNKRSLKDMKVIKALEVNIDDLNYGGVYALMRNVLEHKKSDYLIDIATIEGFRNPENEEYFRGLGSNVFYIGCKKNKFIKQYYVYKNLKNLIKKNHYDNVHIHADTANKLLVSGLAAKSAGAKNIILHSHAAGIEGNHRALKKICHAICRPLLKLTGAHYVACSDLAAKWMFGCADYILVHNGVDLNKFRYSEEQRITSRKKLGLQDEILIGNVGRFAYPKNHEFILKIAKALDETQTNYKIILIGTGELEQAIKDKASNLELKNIIFYGLSDHVDNLFQAMDVFILPSHFEGLPIVGIEAQASGLPVIYSNKITREAKVIDYCTYLDIECQCVQAWVDTILQYSRLERKDTYEALKGKKFDIADTINEINNLYILDIQ